jgi:hypothetical protein
MSRVEVIDMTDDDQRWQEAMKLEYDWHKHMTTLSAGIPLIIAALVTSDLFPNKLNKLSHPEWLVTSLGFLVASILLSLLSMVIAVRYMRSGPSDSATPATDFFSQAFGLTQRFWFRIYRTLTITYSVFFFLGGVVLFLFFGIENV